MTTAKDRQYEEIFAVWVWEPHNRFWFLLCETDEKEFAVSEAKRERGSCNTGEIVKITKHKIRAPKVPKAATVIPIGAGRKRV